MANPLSAIEGEIVEVVVSPLPHVEGMTRIERLDLRSAADASQITSYQEIEVPEDLVGQFRKGVTVRLALFGAPTLRSRLLGGTFDDTTYLRIPPQFVSMRRGTWAAGLIMDAVALACPIFWQGWGAIPGIILFLISLGPLRMASAFPTFEKVKKLLRT